MCTALTYRLIIDLIINLIDVKNIVMYNIYKLKHFYFDVPKLKLQQNHLPQFFYLPDKSINGMQCRSFLCCVDQELDGKLNNVHTESFFKELHFMFSLQPST